MPDILIRDVPQRMVDAIDRIAEMENMSRQHLLHEHITSTFYQKCILVSESNGVYQINPDAMPENWQEVLEAVDDYEHIEGLHGWQPYTAAYRVWNGTSKMVYFVAE